MCKQRKLNEIGIYIHTHIHTCIHIDWCVLAETMEERNWCRADSPRWREEQLVDSRPSMKEPGTSFPTGISFILQFKFHLFASGFFFLIKKYPRRRDDVQTRTAAGTKRIKGKRGAACLSLIGRLEPVQKRQAGPAGVRSKFAQHRGRGSLALTFD